MNRQSKIWRRKNTEQHRQSKDNAKQRTKPTNKRQKNESTTLQKQTKKTMKTNKVKTKVTNMKLKQRQKGRGWNQNVCVCLQLQVSKLCNSGGTHSTQLNKYEIKWGILDLTIMRTPSLIFRLFKRTWELDRKSWTQLSRMIACACFHWEGCKLYMGSTALK